MTQSKDLESTYSEKVRDNKNNKEGKDNTNPFTSSAVTCGTDLGGDGILPYSGTGKTPWEILPVQTLLKIPNPPYILHLVRFPTISVDGETNPSPFECWYDPNCIAEYFIVKIHPWRGAMCVAFDKAEFTNTGWESAPTFCYTSLHGALAQCKGAEMPRQVHRPVEILGWPLERFFLTQSPIKPSQTLRAVSLQPACEPGHYFMHIQMTKTDL